MIPKIFRLYALSTSGKPGTSAVLITNERFRWLRARPE
jgi:hypothetical protein